METANTPKIDNAFRAKVMRAAWASYKSNDSFANFGQALSSEWAIAKSELESAPRVNVIDEMNKMDARTLAKAIGGKAWEKHGLIRVYMPDAVDKRHFNFKDGEWDAFIPYSKKISRKGTHVYMDYMYGEALDAVAKFIGA